MTALGLRTNGTIKANRRNKAYGPKHAMLADGMKRRNKYGAKKTQIGGIWFDSKAEGMHYLLLKDRQRKGEISDLSLQSTFNMVVNGLKVGTYTPDFLYVENRQWVAEDTKGVKTEAFALRAKLFQALHPHIELRINGVASKRPKAAA